MSASLTSFADRVAEKLRANGVDTCFGIPGGRLIPLLNVLEAHGIRFVSSHHECASAFMAAGYTMATGKIAAVLTQGPGTLNALPGLAAAAADAIPMLSIGVQSPRDSFAAGAHQETTSGVGFADTTRLLEGVACFSERPPSAKACMRALDVAFRAARSSRRPAAVEFYFDLFKADLIEPLHFGSTVRSDLTVDLGGVTKIANALSNSHHPLLIIGERLRHQHAGPMIEDFCSKNSIPCVEVDNARGVLPTNYEYLLGTLGRGAQRSVIEYLEMADLCLVIGARLTHDVTLNFNSQLFKRVIQVAATPFDMGRSMSTELEVISDELTFLSHLAEETTNTNARGLKSLVAELCQKHHTFDLSAISREPSNTGVTYREALSVIREYLPDEAKFVTDCGTSAVAAKFHFPSYCYDSHFALYGLATMGTGISVALGVKMGLRETPVVAFIGDGALLVHAPELRLAKEHGIPLLVIVMNNGGYKCVADAQKAFYGRTVGTTFENDNYAAIAAAFGSRCFKVETPEELASAMGHYNEAAGRLTFIEVKTSRSETVFDFVAPEIRNSFEKFSTPADGWTVDG